MSAVQHTIAKTACLATLNISRWSGRKYDATATAEYTASKHASSDAARINKLLVSGKLITPLNRHLSQVRAHFYTNTLPWGDNGDRVLPALKVEDMYEYMADAKQKLDKHLKAFLANYAQEVRDSHARLGDLFDPSDYPSTNEIEAKYGLKFSCKPIPMDGDFRIDFSGITGDAIREQMRNDYAREVDRMTHDAVEHIWHQVGDMLSKVKDRLESSDGRFTSIFDNLNRMIGELGVLNITDDTQLHQLQTEARKKLVALQDPKAIKRDPDARKAAASDVQDVIDKFAGMWE